MTQAIAQRSRNLVVALCFAVAALEGFDIQAIGVAAPKLAPDLGLAPHQMGWVFFVSNLFLVFGASIGGWLADRLGRKPTLIAAVVIFGAATALTCFVDDLSSLVFARALAGLGFGAALPNMMTLAADVSDPNQRARTATLMFCGMPLGGGIAALVTQLLPPDADWRTLFAIGGALPLLLAPVLAIFMPETAARGTERRPRVNVVAALFGGKRARPTLLAWLALFPTQVILYLILYWLPTLALDKGFDRNTAPQVAIAFNFASVAGALFLGQLVDRIGPKGPLTIAYLALLGALAALAAVSGLAPLLVLSGAVGFLLLGANYALLGVVASYYPRDVRGTGSGAAMAVGRVGAILGPLLPGIVLGSGAGVGAVLNLLAPAAALAAIAVFLLSLTPPAPED